MTSPDFPPESRSLVRALAASKVREVANAGFGRHDVLRFWFGESDEPTPEYIRDAGVAALKAGQTFYAHNLGLPELRAALSSYLGALHCRPFDAERICVTSAGVSALMIAMQAILEPGDRVVAVAPVWPNLTEIPRLLGANVTRVPLGVVDGRWRLDLDRLIAAITPATRLLLLNSPGNPTGWILPPADQAVIRDHCRRLGTWILTDDVYERLRFDAPGAPRLTLLGSAEPEDRIIGANSFSKAWLMTGWRVGWLVVPPAIREDVGKLIEYNTSCVPEFVQRAAQVALERGEPHVESLRRQLLARRDLVSRRLRAMRGVEAPTPQGGMYAFFRIASHADSMSLAKRLIAEAKLGLAPGVAFGPEGESWLRWCFAARPDALDAGLGRLEYWLDRSIT